MRSYQTPLFENLVRGSTPPPCRKGVWGEHYDQCYRPAHNLIICPKLQATIFVLDSKDFCEFKKAKTSIYINWNNKIVDKTYQCSTKKSLFKILTLSIYLAFLCLDLVSFCIPPALWELFTKRDLSKLTAATASR